MTYKEWFEKHLSEINSLLAVKAMITSYYPLSQFEDTKINEKEYSIKGKFPEVLLGAFTWGETQEGHLFWREIALEVIKNWKQKGLIK